jgi:hypothetical protein
MHSMNGHGGRATRARADARRIVIQTRHTLEVAGAEVRHRLSTPRTGAVIAGAAVVGAALLIGLPEAILGAIAGLVVHHILERKRSS